MSDSTLRPRSQRLSAKNHKYSSSIKQPTKPTQIYPGLNDVTDALEALPFDLIKYFTLLKEIDAKCYNVIPSLNSKIKHFNTLNPKDDSIKSKRGYKIKEISNLIKDLLPCIEEKMHVATIANDKISNYIDRINDDFELIFKNEIPDSIKYGQLNHPAIINDSKLSDLNHSNRSAQAQRSESRREALAARKAANNQDTDNDDRNSTPSLGATNASTINNNGIGSGSTTTGGNPRGSKARREKESTPSSSATNVKKRKTNNNSSNSSTNQTTNNNINNNNFAGLPSNQTSAITEALKNEDVPQISRPSTPSATKRRTNQKKKQQQGPPPPPPQSSSSSSQPQSQSSNIPNALHTTQQQLSNQHHSSIHNDDLDISGQNAELQKRNSSDEPLYCYCNQVSYGEMVGCDGDDCKREWFHLPCIGLATLPKGKWYCDECSSRLKKNKKL